MENYTVKKLRMDLALSIKEQEKLREEYVDNRLEHPFDKYLLDQLRHNLKVKTEYIIQLKAELETYQLEFLFR